MRIDGVLQGFSGGGGIRTHGRLAPSTVFKTAPFGRSGTPPNDDRSQVTKRHLLTRAGAPKRCNASGTSPWKFSSNASSHRSVAAVPFNVCGVSSVFSPAR
jgi:hypothetical protein